MKIKCFCVKMEWRERIVVWKRLITHQMTRNEIPSLLTYNFPYHGGRKILSSLSQRSLCVMQMYNIIEKWSHEEKTSLFLPLLSLSLPISIHWQWKIFFPSSSSSFDLYRTDIFNKNTFSSLQKKYFPAFFYVNKRSGSHRTKKKIIKIERRIIISRLNEHLKCRNLLMRIVCTNYYGGW
jgi:hypothetical protein